MRMSPAFSRLASAPVLTVIRLIVGGIFVYAGVAKVMNPQAFLADIHSFHILPVARGNPLAILLPPIEIVAGAAWIINRWPRAAAAIVAGLCAVFLGALGMALLRGVSADCGCFGGLGLGSTSLPIALIRDVLLLVATVWWLIVDVHRPIGLNHHNSQSDVVS